MDDKMIAIYCVCSTSRGAGRKGYEGGSQGRGKAGVESGQDLRSAALIAQGRGDPPLAGWCRKSGPTA